MLRSRMVLPARSLSRITVLIAVYLAPLMFQSCGSSGNESDDDYDDGVSAEIEAAVGGTLTTPSGISLSIGPAALPGDTSVSLIPFEPLAAADGNFIAGARMEPDGLILDSAVVVRFPLPYDWPTGATPLVFEFKGSDFSAAVPTFAYARVGGSSGHYYAEVLTSHFSGVICAENCHAGTMKHVLNTLAARGCNRDSVLAYAQRQFPSVPISDECGARNPEAVQALLDTYFDDYAEFDENYSVSSNVLAGLEDDVRSGRQVVLAFKPGAWGERSGPNNFLSTSVLDYAHTAPLEVHEGRVQIRNTLATSDESLISALGGDNTVWYPFSELNAFRRLPQGVAAEIQICGEPDCLSDPDRNPYGIAPYHPVEGVSYAGRAWSDPWTYMLSSGSWSGIPPRGVPWGAVHIYLEKAHGPQEQLCAPAGEEARFDASVSIPGYTHQFHSIIALGAFAEYDDEPGYPAVFGGEGSTVSETSFLEYDEVRLIFNKTLPGPGTYPFSDGSPGFKAFLVYTTPEIADEDTGIPTVFSTTSGTVTLTKFGTAVGAPVEGTFSSNLTGDKAIYVDGEIQYLHLTGTIAGSFSAVLSNWDGSALGMTIPIRGHLASP